MPRKADAQADEADVIRLLFPLQEKVHLEGAAGGRVKIQLFIPAQNRTRFRGIL